MKMIIAALVMVNVLMLAGCGGGGGGTATISKPSTAVITLSSQGVLPAGKALSGFIVTIELPAGVTAKTGTNGAVEATVVVPSGLLAGGEGTMGPVIYTPATAGVRAKINFTMASMSATGVGTGEYATITLSLSDVAPAVNDFTIISFTPVDMSYAHISGLTPRLNVSLF